MPAVRHSLDPIFRPRSVAVFGASATPGSVGAILMRNLLGNPFGGGVYPINPKRAHRPRRPLLPRPGVRAGGRGPGRDRHAGADRAGPGRRLRRPRRAGRDRHLGRLLRTGRRGPRPGSEDPRPPAARCASSAPTASASSTRRATSTPASPRRWPRPAASPSSARAAPSAPPSSTGRSNGTSASAASSASAPCSTWTSPTCSTTSATTRPRKAIVLYMESIGDVRKFLSAARSVSRTKHVIVVKSGRHEAGARAAASHTGALAGSDAVFDAAFRRAGVLRVTTIPDLFNMSEILSMQPPPRGPALAIITNAGGPGVMAVDDLMTRGGQLAPLSPADAGRPQRRPAAVLEPRQPHRPARRRHGRALPPGRRAVRQGRRRPRAC